MNWDVFLVLSSIQVQLHWLLAVFAFLLGTTVLLLRKGTARHVLLGRTWVVIMVIVSLSALFIRAIPGEGGLPNVLGFSPIHLLIPFTLAMLFLAIKRIRQGNVRAHKTIMIFTFVGSLVVAGAFTFLPGRHMHTFFFGDPDLVQKHVERGFKK